MAVYSYKALTARGRSIKGLIDAESARAARQKLKDQGYFPTSLEETRGGASRGAALGLTFRRSPRVSTSQLAVATRQLATLSAAGMPLVEALSALGEQIDSQALREVIFEVRDKVNEGATFAASLRQYSSIFPRLYANMVESGEASGTLDAVLERLADLLESQAVLQRKVVTALTYPALMLLLCLGVIFLLVGYVVPQITVIFENQGAALPLPTRIVIAASDFLQAYWLLLLIFLILFSVGLRTYVATEQGRRSFDRLRLNAPVVGALHRKIATARLARNLGMMLSSGIQLLTAMGIVKNIVGNVLLEEAVSSASEGVREGNSLWSELNKSNLFPRLLIHMIAVGERTGQLENMLIRAAGAYESEIDAAISAFTSVLEPLLIVFVAFIVGGILGAVMLPMLEMTALTR